MQQLWPQSVADIWNAWRAMHSGVAQALCFPAHVLLQLMLPRPVNDWHRVGPEHHIEQIQ